MDKNLFFYELEGRGYTFQNKNWDEAKHGFEDDMLNMAWEMWSSAKHSVKAQAVPEGYVVVPMEPTEQILNRMTNAPIEVNHLCDNADIFLSEDEARIAYKAMIEAQEPAND